MDHKEFIQKIKRIGKLHNVKIRWEPKRGKGSHGTLYYGDRKAVLKQGELGEGLLMAVLKQLGIPKNVFK